MKITRTKNKAISYLKNYLKFYVNAPKPSIYSHNLEIDSIRSNAKEKTQDSRAAENRNEIEARDYIDQSET